MRSRYWKSISARKRNFGGPACSANEAPKSCLILLVLWLLGMVSSYTMGGFIHILMVLTVVTVLIQLIDGRRAV